MEELHQGDILKIERIKSPVLVVSKNFFNDSGMIIGCPILKNSIISPLHIPVSTEEVEGHVQCENMTLLDLSIRGHKKLDRITYNEIMNITDAIQGIFDYI